MLSFDGLFKLDGSQYGIEEDISLVSHAHSDHLSGCFVKNKVVCSDITEKIIRVKKGLKKVNICSHPKIKMFDAGHILGSKMFLINNELLYTGDLNTKGFFEKAQPVKCKTLIVESTFGLPQYRFSDKDNVIKELCEYINKNENVLIITSDVGFGKPQELCAVLDRNGISFNVSENIERFNLLLKLKFKNFSKEADVIITNYEEAKHFPNYYKKVFLSGWCSDGNYLSGFDKSFAYSSHCDYKSLIEFVKKCNPEKIYTHHGYAKELAEDLRKRGFDAYPLYELVGTNKRRKKISGKKEYKTLQRSLLEFV